MGISFVLNGIEISHDGVHTSVDTDHVGEDAQVVILDVSPLAACVVLVIVAAAAVYIIDPLLHLGVGEIGLFRSHGTLSCDLEGHTGCNKNIDAAVKAENVVRAAAYDDAGAF